MSEEKPKITHHEAKHFFKKWIKELEQEVANEDENDPVVNNHAEKIDYLNWTMEQLDQLESENGYYN